MAKKSAKKSKITTLHGEAIGSDSERIESLRSRMTPSDRQNYDYIFDAIKISLDTGRLSVFPQLIKQKEEIERRYETDSEDQVSVTWDDAALQEASGA